MGCPPVIDSLLRKNEGRPVSDTLSAVYCQYRNGKTITLVDVTVFLKRMEKKINRLIR